MSDIEWERDGGDGQWAMWIGPITLRTDGDWWGVQLDGSSDCRETGNAVGLTACKRAAEDAACGIAAEILAAVGRGP